MLSCVVLGSGLGSLGGVAYAATFQHTAGLWNHGIDGRHIYMTRTDGGSSRGVIAAIWTFDGRRYHGDDLGYEANHVHLDGQDGFATNTVAGHYSSPGPYLGHHEHP